MSDNYLWDRSGEPDPEIENLEKILGRFQHQKSEFHFPNKLDRRNYFIKIGAAAAALMIFLIGGIFSYSRIGIMSGQRQAGGRSTQNNSQPSVALPNFGAVNFSKPNQMIVQSGPDLAPRNFDSDSSRGYCKPRIRHTLIAHSHNEQARAAARLLLAMRIASEKLNGAQRRVEQMTYQ